MKKALIIQSMQNDFMPGGVLAVKDADKIIPRIKEYLTLFSENQECIFAVRDWHISADDHGEHFKVFPVHCIQFTEGARFHRDLQLEDIEDWTIISKGMEWNDEGLSVFKGFDTKGKQFIDILKERQVDELYICGVTTDYGIKATALEGIELGFKVNVLVDAIAGIDEGNSVKALQEMEDKGANRATIMTLITRFKREQNKLF